MSPSRRKQSGSQEIFDPQNTFEIQQQQLNLQSTLIIEPVKVSTRKQKQTIKRLPSPEPSKQPKSPVSLRSPAGSSEREIRELKIHSKKKMASFDQEPTSHNADIAIVSSKFLNYEAEEQQKLDLQSATEQFESVFTPKKLDIVGIKTSNDFSKQKAAIGFVDSFKSAES